MTLEVFFKELLRPFLTDSLKNILQFLHISVLTTNRGNRREADSR